MPWKSSGGPQLIAAQAKNLCPEAACVVSRVGESNLPSGSSRIRNSGSMTSALASVTRCAMPPESSCG